MAELLLKRIKRFVLKLRIEQLHSDIVLAAERRTYAQLTVESIDKWSGEAWQRLRKLKAKLALIEPPDVLLAEAMQGPRHE